MRVCVCVCLCSRRPLLKCKKLAKRVSELKQQHEDADRATQRLQEEVGELKRKLKAAKAKEGEPSPSHTREMKRLQDQVAKLQKQLSQDELQNCKAAKTQRSLSTPAAREPLEEMKNRQPPKTSPKW